MKEELSPTSSSIRNREGPPVASDAAGRDRSLFRSILENEVLNSGIEDPRDLQNKKRRVFHVRNYINIIFLLTFKFYGFFSLV